MEIISRFKAGDATAGCGEDYFAPETWRSYQERAGAGWILPDQD
jgi:hypothetical protein